MGSCLGSIFLRGYLDIPRPAQALFPYTAQAMGVVFGFTFGMLDVEDEEAGGEPSMGNGKGRVQGLIGSRGIASRCVGLSGGGCLRGEGP